MLSLIVIGIAIFMLLTGRVHFLIGINSVQSDTTPGELTTRNRYVDAGFSLSGPTPQPEASDYPGGYNYTPAIGPDSDAEEVYSDQ